MLTVGITVLIAEGVGRVNRPGTFLMATSGNVLVGVGTLHSRAVEEIDDLRCTRSRRTITYLPEVIRRLHIVARAVVLLKEELSGVDIDIEVIPLHIGQITRAASLKTVVHTEAVDVIAVIRARQSVHGDRQSVGQIPLSCCQVLDDGVIVERLEVINEVAAVVPLAKELRRHRV